MAGLRLDTIEPSGLPELREETIRAGRRWMSFVPTSLAGTSPKLARIAPCGTGRKIIRQERPVGRSSPFRGAIGSVQANALHYSPVRRRAKHALR